MGVEYRTPTSVHAPIGKYSHIALADSVACLAGQVGVDLKGNIVGDSIALQTPQIFSNIGALLDELGLDFQHVLKFNTYVVGPEAMSEFYAAREKVFSNIFPDGIYPPNTLIGVTHLAEPALKVEVETLVALRP